MLHGHLQDVLGDCPLLKALGLESERWRVACEASKLAIYSRTGPSDLAIKSDVISALEASKRFPEVRGTFYPVL